MYVGMYVCSMCVCKCVCVCMGFGGEELGIDDERSDPILEILFSINNINNNINIITI